MTKLIKNKGYWQANGKYFDIKVNAILEAQSNNSDVTFHYNDQAWDQADWSVEPTQSLEELYLQRALALRKKYKTLILRLSGGADSMNIVRTFVDNNIKIDVIVINEWCGLNGDDPRTHPGSAEKIAITMPFLDSLRQQGVQFEQLELDNSYLFSCIENTAEWIFRINAPRFRMVEVSAPRTVLHDALQQYNSSDTCVITGLDKPRVWCVQDKLWYFSIPDLINVLSDPGHSLMVQEPFYWTADMPELVIKQCHVIKNWAKANETLAAKAQADQRKNNLDKSDSYHFYSKKWLVPLLYSKYYHFSPGDQLPYLNVSEIANHGPYCGVIDYGIERMPIFGTHLKGVQLADKLIETRFKRRDSIFQDGLKEIWTKRRWLGR